MTLPRRLQSAIAEYRRARERHENTAIHCAGRAHHEECRCHETLHRMEGAAQKLLQASYATRPKATP